MSEVTFVPFNHDPSANDYGNTSTSYTPAAGKYAIVTATLYVDAYGEAGLATGANPLGGATSNSNTAVIELRIDTGEAVTATSTAASSTTGSVNSGTTSSVSVASLSVGGNKVSEIKASASAWHSSGSGSATSTVSGTADVNFHVAEYNTVS